MTQSKNTQSEETESLTCKTMGFGGGASGSACVIMEVEVRGGGLGVVAGVVGSMIGVRVMNCSVVLLYQVLAVRGWGGLGIYRCRISAVTERRGSHTQIVLQNIGGIFVQGRPMGYMVYFSFRAVVFVFPWISRDVWGGACLLHR